MSRRLTGIKDVETMAGAVDSELSRVELIAKSGAVSKVKLASSADSYFFIDKGVLKFFNAVDSTTKTVTVG
jgi:hypothetical protein